MRIFLDSSALAKKYIAEKGSERIVTIWQEAEDISLSILYVPEVLSACDRLRRGKKLDEKGYEAIKGGFFRDIEDTQPDQCGSLDHRGCCQVPQGRDHAHARRNPRGLRHVHWIRTFRYL